MGYIYILTYRILFEHHKRGVMVKSWELGEGAKLEGTGHLHQTRIKAVLRLLHNTPDRSQECWPYARLRHTYMHKETEHMQATNRKYFGWPHTYVQKHMHATNHKYICSV